MEFQLKFLLFTLNYTKFSKLGENRKIAESFEKCINFYDRKKLQKTFKIEFSFFLNPIQKLTNKHASMIYLYHSVVSCVRVPGFDQKKIQNYHIMLCSNRINPIFMEIHWKKTHQLL